MAKHVEAIYQDGVLRPLEPISLSEQERVRLVISRCSQEEWMDSEFMESCSIDGDASISLSEVRAALSKIQGSMSEVVIEERGRY